MGIAKPPPVCSSSKTITVFSHTKTQPYPVLLLHHQNYPAQKPNPHHDNSMSGHQQYHPHQENIFSFPNGFDRSAGLSQQDQIRSDIDQTVAAQDPSAAGLHPVYETAGMLSEMFNFVHGPGPAASSDILDYRRAVGGLGPDWYGSNSSRQVARESIGDHQHHHHPHQQQQQHSDHQHQIPSINAESAAAMQLFLTNPPPRSPSPPESTSGSTLHMLLPNPSNIHAAGGAFHPVGVLHPPNANYWSTAGPGGAHINSPGELGGVVEGQGLSLSLSSSLQHQEAAKQAEQLRNMQGGGDSTHIMFFNQPSSSTTTSSPGHFFKNLQQQQPIMHNLQGFGSGPGQQQVHIGFGSATTSSSSMGVVNALRNSKYAKAAQELLEEFCSVGRGHLKKSKSARNNSVNPNEGGYGAGSSSSKDPAQLSAVDRIEHQRRKVKLLSMLDEVERRYNHYCEQTQMVVNSYEVVMGYGAAIPYTALAQKAMSRHFRCLKEAIQTELRKSCEVLGEKDPTASTGLSKGETPRLKMLEQSLRQQRAFHQMGMMEQEAWRPQRGLPDRSVNVLRAWLFEHFLHPYPNDADKHLLARQTGLSRNQVSNWFINARVRLWKPMVEEMYQQEAKEIELEDDVEERERNQTSSSTSNSFATTHQHQHAQNPMPPSASASTTILTEEAKRSAETMTPPVPPDTDPSQLLAINRHHQPTPHHATALPQSQAFLHGSINDNTHFGAAPPDNVGHTTMIRFGAASGDVSLTLGLRHAGNAPEKSAAFSVRDFGSC